MASEFLRPEKRRKGFTLIEVIIVVGITSMLASLVLTYTSTSRDQVALYVEEAKLAQTVSRAKSLALSIFARAGAEVPCGYGVELDYASQEYSVFSYSADDCSAPSALDPAGIQYTGKDSLPLNVRLEEAEDDSIQTIVFLAPDPKTLIWHVGKLAPSTSGRIYLRTISGSSLSIQVSNAGQISF